MTSIDNFDFFIPTAIFVEDDAIVQYIGEMNDREDYDEGLVPHRVRRFKSFELVQTPLAWFRPEEHDEPFSASLVEEYRQAPAAEAPPIVVDSEDHSIIDGFHRFQAALARGDTHIASYVGRDPRPGWSPWMDTEDDCEDGDGFVEHVDLKEEITTLRRPKP